MEGAIRFQNYPKSQSTASWRAKPVPAPSNLRVFPDVARPVGTNHWLFFSGISIYGPVQVSYCHVQNINFGISLSFVDLLAAITIRISREILPDTC
jgi:hypothetical protein